ncbi:uncharacterized protein LOC143879065 [Tasmannia lanceolata]|uniref:uncharacterized protein LOC143879065 n=1 Tax=Tasmannia lanceolata TaxID=3420 RepID=UPI004062F7C5
MMEALMAVVVMEVHVVMVVIQGVAVVMGLDIPPPDFVTGSVVPILSHASAPAPLVQRDSLMFDQAEYEELVHLRDRGKRPTATFAQPGSSSCFLSSNASRSWLIDSRASHHMTSNFKLLLSSQHHLDLKTGTRIGLGREMGGLYYLDSTLVGAALHTSVDAYQWHYCLGHPHADSLRKSHFITKHVESFSCESCELGKHHRVAFPSRGIRCASRPYELNHSDVWGPSRAVSLFGFRYFVILMDDFHELHDGPVEPSTVHSLVVGDRETSEDRIEPKAKVYTRGPRQIVLSTSQPSSHTADPHSQSEDPTSGTSFPISDSPIGSRTRSHTTTAHPISQFVSYEHLSPSFRSFVSNVSSISLPKSISDALAHLETFSLVAKISSVRVLISIVVNCGWPLYQLDVKNSFLHGDLGEEVYMEQPPGYVAHGGDVFMSMSSTESNLWSQAISESMVWEVQSAVIRFGMKQCAVDHSVFSYQSTAGYILIVYVDDIVITGDDKVGIRRLKIFLQEFFTKDPGLFRYFLGSEVARSKYGLSLSQRMYTLDILEEKSSTRES